MIIETMIKAVKREEDLVKEMNNFLADEKHYHLWWLGQSGYLLQWKGHRVLLDPYLSDSLTKKYAGSSKPHTRMSELVVAPELLKNILVVTSSHNHTDHLDAATLVPVLRNNPAITFIIPEANRAFVAARVGCAVDFPTGLSDGRSVTVGPFTFHGIPAKHNEIERDEQGNCKYMGFIITFGDHAIYHSGDTLWFHGMEEKVKPFAPELALLPINGNDPAREVAGNLNAGEAVKLGKALGVRFVIPCHYDMFSFNTADVTEFAREADKMGQPYRVLQHGGRFDSQ